ncbi:MAG: glycosyltransferase [Planctomycetes bacterium]|nr:glycosyltransferase [Planctomycetota bacterium]
MHLIPDLRIGGAERMAVTLANGLAESGNKVLLVAVRNGGPQEAQLRTDLGIELIILGLNRASIKRPFSFFRSVRRIRMRLDQIIRDFKPDVVHSHIPEDDLFLSGSVRRTKIGVHVPVIHSINFHLNRERFGIRGRTRMKILSRAIRRATAVWAVSDAVARSVAEKTGLGDCDITVMPNGIDLSHFSKMPNRLSAREQLGLPQGVPMILGVGRLDPIKNYLLMIDASSIVLNKYPNAVFVIAGEGAHRTEMEQRIETLGVGENWLLLGQRDDIPLCLAAADFFVQPSHCEGFGLAIIEAMASSRAVIATDVGGVSEILKHEHTGLLVPQGDRRALANGMLKLLNEPDLSRQLGEAGKTYTWKEHGVESYLQKVNVELHRLLEPSLLPADPNP